jgi:hypothetical protein
LVVVNRVGLLNNFIEVFEFPQYHASQDVGIGMPIHFTWMNSMWMKGECAMGFCMSTIVMPNISKKTQRWILGQTMHL